MQTYKAIESELKKLLVAGKANVLYGARRVGKTFLLRKIKKNSA